MAPYFGIFTPTVCCHTARKRHLPPSFSRPGVLSNQRIDILSNLSIDVARADALEKPAFLLVRGNVEGPHALKLVIVGSVETLHSTGGASDFV